MRGSLRRRQVFTPPGMNSAASSSSRSEAVRCRAAVMAVIQSPDDTLREGHTTVPQRAADLGAVYVVGDDGRSERDRQHPSQAPGADEPDVLHGPHDLL